MIPLIGAAAVLGLSAGFSPGPLLTLVIAQSRRYGTREGIKVAIAPLVTDAPIIAVSVLIVSRLAGIHYALGIISMSGGLFVLYLAWETFRAEHPSSGMPQVRAGSIARGIAVNALSPHPYIFWITVGAPVVIRAYRESPLWAVLFIVSFLVCLIGAKVLVAFLVGRSKKLLTGKIYRLIMVSLGIALFIFALALIRDGLKLSGIIAKFP